MARSPSSFPQHYRRRDLQRRPAAAGLSGRRRTRIPAPYRTVALSRRTPHACRVHLPLKSRDGFEPSLTALQAAASPLGQRDVSGRRTNRTPALADHWVSRPAPAPTRGSSSVSGEERNRTPHPEDNWFTASPTLHAPYVFALRSAGHPRAVLLLRCPHVRSLELRARLGSVA